MTTTNQTIKDIEKEIKTQLELKEIIENTNDDFLRDKSNRKLLERIDGWGHYQILQAKLQATKETAEQVKTEVLEMLNKFIEDYDYDSYQKEANVLKEFKAILETKPQTRNVKVVRKGTGMNTEYTVVQLD